MCENEKNKMRVLEDFIGFSIEPSHYLSSRGLVYSRNTLPLPMPIGKSVLIVQIPEEIQTPCLRRVRPMEHYIELVNINLDLIPLAKNTYFEQV